MTWQIKKLGEVCDVSAGNSAPQNNEFFKNGKYPFFRTSDIGQIHIGVISDSSDYLNEKGVKGLRMFSKGTILIPKSGASTFLNHRVVLGVDGYVSSHLATIKTDKKVLDNIFLFYFLQEVKAQDLIQDHKYPSLNLPVIENLEIPVPPLAEQKRIVGILDEVFENIQRARENTEKNLQNAKELFESYLQNIFSHPSKDPASAKGSGEAQWEEKRLADVFQIKPPKKEAHEKLKENDLVSFLPMEDMGIGVREFLVKKERKLKEVAGSYTYFANEDVLMAKITPCFENGKIGIARNLKNGIGFGSSEYIVFRSSGEVTPDYLYYFLNREQFRIEGAKRMSGAVGHKRVAKEFVENYILLFPRSLAEQKEIVEKLDELSTNIKKLEENYRQKLLDLDELKKSVLKKAFSGKL